METAASTEKRRAQAIASDFRKHGYVVLEEPSQQQLPVFLSECSPDLLAYRAGESAESLGESVVVVVKARKGSKKGDDVGKLAGLLREKPGWQFQMALVDTEWQLDLPDSAVPFGGKEIWESCAEALTLLEAGFEEAALMRVWSGLVASVRYLLNEDEALDEEERIRDTSDGPNADGCGLSADRHEFNYMSGYAVYKGIISNDQHEFLREVKRCLDAYVNGYRIPGMSAANTVHEAIAATRSIWGLPVSPDPY